MNLLVYHTFFDQGHDVPPSLSPKKNPSLNVAGMHPALCGRFQSEGHLALLIVMRSHLLVSFSTGALNPAVTASFKVLELTVTCSPGRILIKSFQCRQKHLAQLWCRLILQFLNLSLISWHMLYHQGVATAQIFP